MTNFGTAPPMPTDATMQVVLITTHSRFNTARPEAVDQFDDGILKDMYHKGHEVSQSSFPAALSFV